MSIKNKFLYYVFKAPRFLRPFHLLFLNIINMRSKKSKQYFSPFFYSFSSYSLLSLNLSLTTCLEAHKFVFVEVLSFLSTYNSSLALS